jgi:hypothetical protein
VSSTILMVIVLVVMWVVVLVPMFVRRHEDASEARSKERIATAVRVLARRPAAAPAEPVVPIDVDDEEPVQPRVGHVRAAAHRRMLRRRRRTLALLAVVAVGGVAAAIAVATWFWSVAGLGAALFASYVVWLRAEVRRQEQRWLRRAAAYSRTTPSQPARVARPSRRAAARAGRPAATVTEPAQAAPEQEQEQEQPGSGTWEPTPVPVPTYVNKDVARPRPRPDSVVALDDSDDPSLAEIEDVVPPLERRRVVNG